MRQTRRRLVKIGGGALFAWLLWGGAVVARAEATGSVEVAKVYGLAHGARTNAVGLGDWVIVEVAGVSSQQQASATKDKSKVLLVLDDTVLKGLCTYVGLTTNTARSEFRFRLLRTDATRDDWAALLGRPKLFPTILPLPMHVGVGFDDGSKVLGGDDVGVINFVVIHECWFWFCLVLSVLVLVAVYLLATKTEALRDDGPVPSEKKLRPYSLARCQMAFWFTLVVPSFVFLWLVTGALDTLTQSILVLMGVSAGTAVFAHAQAAGKQDDTLADKLRRRQELERNPARTAAEQTELTQIPRQIARLAPASDGFIKDALKDDVGVSFHHFQLFVWTVVMGIIYVHEVWYNLAMPEFSGTMLGLMGISSGTYLGFALAAKPAAEQSATSGPAAATPAAGATK